MENRELKNLLLSGCKFKYFSYDHHAAAAEFKEKNNDGVCFGRIDCWTMPEELKEKYKVERIGKIRSIEFLPNGQIYRVRIGAKRAKSFFPNDFGVSVFPIIPAPSAEKEYQP